MIKKIDIPSFGQFKDYKWDQKGLKGVDFKQLNIIYGKNYSGKTTLSRIFASIEQGHIVEEYIKGASFKLTTEEGELSESTLSNSSPYQFRVYNSDFVKRNLAFFYDETKSIESFAVIGSTNNEIQVLIDAINGELEGKEQGEGKRAILRRYAIKLQELEEKQRSEVEHWEKQRKDEAKQIKLDPLLWTSRTKTYNVTTINKEIEEILSARVEAISLDADMISMYQKTIMEEVKPEMKCLPDEMPQLQQFIERARGLVTKEINLSKVIEALREDARLNEWVEAGCHLHEDGHQVCKFCGNPISEARWQGLKEHFSKDASELRSAIDALLNKLRGAKEALAIFIQERGISSSSFYFSLGHDYATWEEGWNCIKSEYGRSIDALIQQLEARRQDLFMPQKWHEVADPSSKILDSIRSLNELISKNNIWTENLNNEKEEASKRLRYNRILDFLERSDDSKNKEIRDRGERIKDLKKVYDELHKEVENLECEKQRLKRKLLDEGKAVEAINAYLSEFFHLDHLHLEAQIPISGRDDAHRGKFVIKRGEKIAQQLSDGERSLIAFCYFIAKIQDDLNSDVADKLIIFMDDPMSSLDSTHISDMFDLIDTIICHPQKYHQLFISTHNLEFFKRIQRLTARAGSRCSLNVYRMEHPEIGACSMIQEMPEL